MVDLQCFFRLICLFMLTQFSPAARGQCEFEWLPGSHSAGLPLSAGAQIVWDDGRGPALYVAGEFANAAGVICNRIFRWDGKTIETLGDGIDDGHVNTMTVFNDQLVIGGVFNSVSGLFTQSVAAWDGTQWHRMGSGLNGEVHALQVHDNELFVGGHIHISGQGPISRVGRWNGLQWQRVDGGPADVVFALESYDDRLVVGGYPSTFGNTINSSIAAWDGQNWSSLGPGITDDAVTDMKAHAGDLFVAGWFDSIGGMQIADCARWDGIAWHDAADISANIDSFLSVGNELFAGGFFRNDDESDHGIARWNGTEWRLDDRVMELTPSSNIDSIAMFDGMLHVAGGFRLVSNPECRNFTAFDAGAWRVPIPVNLSNYTDGEVGVLRTIGGTLYAGGAFDILEGSPVRDLARWTGTEWVPLGSGVDGPWVRDIIEYNGDLVAGGYLFQAGGINVHNVARWDGAQWHAFGGGVNGNVFTLAEYRGDLIVGGFFTEVDQMPAIAVARWDGSAWHPMDLPGGNGSACNRLIVYNGQLIAAVGLVNQGLHLLVWNGTGWEPFAGTGPIGVGSLHEHCGDLYVSGIFSSIAGESARNIARWDGQNWWPLANGITSMATVMASYGDDLIVGGLFDQAGGTNARRIARWDGSQWHAFGTGVSGFIYSGGSRDGLAGILHGLAVLDNTIVVGGAFTIANGSVSTGLARIESSCEPTRAELADLNVILGTVLVGNLDSLREDDDHVLRLRSAIGFSQFEPNLTRVRVGALNALGTATSINVSVTARIDHPNGTATIRMRDWATGQFITVDEYVISTMEETQTVEDLSAAQFLVSCDNRIEIEHQIVVVATFSVLGFIAELEQVEVETY